MDFQRDRRDVGTREVIPERVLRTATGKACAIPCSWRTVPVEWHKVDQIKNFTEILNASLRWPTKTFAGIEQPGMVVV